MSANTTTHACKVAYLHVQNIFSMISSLEKNQMVSRMTEDEIQDVRIPISVVIVKDVSPFPPDTWTAKGPELTAEIYINSSQLRRTLRIKRGLCFTCCMTCDKAEAMRVSCQLPLKN